MANEKNEGKRSDPATKTPDLKVAHNFGQGEVSEKELEKIVGGYITSHPTGGGSQGVPTQSVSTSNG